MVFSDSVSLFLNLLIPNKSINIFNYGNSNFAPIPPFFSQSKNTVRMTSFPAMSEHKSEMEEREDGNPNKIGLLQSGSRSKIFIRNIVVTLGLLRLKV